MSVSTELLLTEQKMAHSADVDFLVRKAMNTGYQVFSLITPAAYTAFIIARKGRAAWSLNRTLRATWLGGLGGTAACGGGAYLRYANTSFESTRVSRIESAYDTDRIRREDHSTIGAVILGVLTPALLWKRASTINLILGGAGIGSGVGVVTHYFRRITGDEPPKVTPIGH